jgi:hypothetical protein
VFIGRARKTIWRRRGFKKREKEREREREVFATAKKKSTAAARHVCVLFVGLKSGYGRVDG